MKYLLLVLGFWGFLALSEELPRGTGAVITPTIPATCYDGIKHTKLNAIDSVAVGETDRFVSVVFRIYMVDCQLQNDGTMNARYYGPLHAGRCDQSILPYDGAFTYSQTGKLVDPSSNKEIDICHIGLNFEASKLKQNADNIFKYIYRHEAIGEYFWAINMRYDPAQNAFTPTMTEIPAGAVVGNNLDRTNGLRTIKCNYDTAVKKLQGFGIEGPIAKVVGSKLELSFYAIGLTCSANEQQGYHWTRDKLRTVQFVVIRNSANSPIGYDWNTFSRPINSGQLENLVTYVMPLAEVMEPDQLALFKSGKMGTVKFKVSVGNNTYMGPRADLELTINLDPEWNR